MQIIKSLANNLSIRKLLGLKSDIRAIEARNKEGKSKKVCKVMVVGEARTGKTSLVRSLNNQPFDEHQSVTNLVQISDFSEQCKQWKSLKNEVEMKIFDFGGQEIFNFIHPLFQSSQQCIVILVVNQCTQSLEKMKEQIDFLRNFHQSEILVVATCFAEEEVKTTQEGTPDEITRRRKIDKDQKLSETQIQALGIARNRFVAISNKEGNGIEQVVGAITAMIQLKAIGWSLSGRGDCLREHLASMQAKHPVLPDFKGDFATGRDHNHSETFLMDLLILEKSGWLFTFSRNSQNTADKKAAPVSVIHENLIVQLLQGLFTVDMNHKKRVLPVDLVVNGLISEHSFRKYFNKVYKQISRNTAPKSEMGESWEIVADLVSSFSICHRIGKRETKRIVPCILFPALLPTFEEAGKQGMWNNLKIDRKKGVTRKLIVAGKYGDKRKVMDFIFPRLIIKMWDAVVDVNLCCQDKFVVRGDATPDDFSQEVDKMKNVMIVTRTENEAIKVERIGDCFGRMFQLEEEFDRLFVEFRKCFGIILASRQSKSNNFEVELECSACTNKIASSALSDLNLDEVREWIGDQQDCVGCNKKHRAVETIENLSDLARVFCLLKKFGKSSRRVEEELGDFVNFPRNQITVADKEHRKFLKGKKLKQLRIQRKLQQVSPKEAIFQCCFRGKKNEVMVSKYLHCRMIDYSVEQETADSSWELKQFEEFLQELGSRSAGYSTFTKSVEQLKSKFGAESSLPCAATKFFAQFEKLKEGMNSDFYDIFRKELRKIMKNLEEMASTREKVKSIVEMMNKICLLTSRANAMEVMQTLRLQRNALHVKKGAMFSEVALHSFEDVFVEKSNHPPQSVIVDLMNIFDGPLQFPPFSVHVYNRKDEVQSYGGEIKERLLMFLQICQGVKELKKLGIVHRNITLENTVTLARSKWVCLSAAGFGMAIQCPTKAMILSPDEHKGLYGTSIPPPELQDSGAIKMDKFDVHSLGLILQELIDSFRISHSRKEEKTGVIEFLKKVQKRMLCEYEGRMSIEEVIGVLEWMLFAKTSLGIYQFKGTCLPTAELWDCQSEQEIMEMQKKIMLAGIGKGSRFSLEEMMEMHFVLAFTFEKNKRILQWLGSQTARGIPALCANLPIEEYDRIIYIIKNLQNVSLENLHIKRVLGAGGRGIVWLVEVNLNGEIFQLALKMILNYEAISIPDSGDKDIDREFETLSSFRKNHKNIVQILSKFTAEPTPQMMETLHSSIRECLMEENPITGIIKPAKTRFFLSDYYPLSLDQRLASLGRKLNRQEIYKYSRDLLSASLFLFENCVVHRDVKLDNILVAETEAGDHLVLADFGESAQTDEHCCAPKENLKAGNPLHTAPEVLDAIKADEQIIDFSGQYSWETGFVIYEIIEGRFPFIKFPYAESAELLEFAHTVVHEKLLDLVKKMLKVNPTERISIQDAWDEFVNIPL